MGNDASEKKDQEERIRENGQVTLGGGRKGRIHLLSIIGEIEGHENLWAALRPPSMSISCRSLRRWRTIRTSMGS